VASPFKVRVCDRSVGGTAGSNLARGHECLSLVSVMCCQAEVSATGRSLVQRSPTVCNMSVVVRSWPNRGCCAMEAGGEGELDGASNHWASNR
jgi:hypothetical protein